MSRWIVLAWTVEEREWDGTPFARDLGASPCIRVVKKPRAAVWCRGGDAEVETAQAYLDSDSDMADGRVYTYPLTEKDPLGRARGDIMGVEEYIRARS